VDRIIHPEVEVRQVLNNPLLRDYVSLATIAFFATAKR
jgi:hypothetical protein